MSKFNENEQKMADEIQEHINNWDEVMIDEYANLTLEWIGYGELKEDDLEGIYKHIERQITANLDPCYYESLEEELGEEYAEFYYDNADAFESRQGGNGYAPYDTSYVDEVYNRVTHILSYNKPALDDEAFRKFFDEANERIENDAFTKKVYVRNLEEDGRYEPLEDIGELLDKNLFGYTINGLEFDEDDDALMDIRKTKDGETSNINDEVVENFFKIAA